MCGGGGGGLGDITGGFSDAIGGIGDAARSIAEPIRATTTALSDTPALLANGQNYLLQKGMQGIGGVISNPQMVAGIASGIATGGVSTGLGALTGAAGGDYGSLLTGLLGNLTGGGRSAAPSVSVVTPSTSPGDFAAPGAGRVPIWVWIAGGVVALGAVVFIAVKAFGGRK